MDICTIGGKNVNLGFIAIVTYHRRLQLGRRQATVDHSTPMTILQNYPNLAARGTVNRLMA